MSAIHDVPVPPKDAPPEQLLDYGAVAGAVALAMHTMRGELLNDAERVAAAYLAKWPTP